MEIVNWIKSLDTELFLFFNSKHNDFFDFIFYWFSNKYIWIPLYLFLFFVVYKHATKRIWLVVLAAVLLITLSDQVSVHAFKNVFLRYRPCHNLLIQAKVHLNGSCGGMYGFVSSHAANTFAAAMFLSLLIKNKIKNFGLLIFLWAIVVSYSRIYNGVHYPADVVLGGILGMGIGIVVFKFYQNTDTRIQLK